jgi:hypothetical protein
LTEQDQGPSGELKSAEEVAADIDPVIRFLRGGLDALR